MTDPDDLDRLYLDIFETDQRGSAIFEDLVPPLRPRRVSSQMAASMRS
jgi:hypothetical protein